MITQILNIDPKNPQLEYIIKAAEIIRQGGLVAFPTETVYGLGADFFDESAIKKLNDIKKRPAGKPYTVHIAALEDIGRFECDISAFSKELMELFWPGPLTLIFDTARYGKIGIRMPNNTIARELIRQSNTLIAAPSANISGSEPPKNAKDVIIQFKDKIDLILDAGETQLGRESTIIDLTVFPYKIVRSGAITREKIAETEFYFWKNKVAPTIEKILFICTGNSCRSVMAEGYLRKRLKEIERDEIEVISRGIITSALPGATTEVLEILRSCKVDMSGHRSTVLTDKDIEYADLILVMEELHRVEVLERMPSKRERVYLLAEFGLWGGCVQDAYIEISDPIGMPLDVYTQAFGAIKEAVERLIKILI